MPLGREGPDRFIPGVYGNIRAIIPVFERICQLSTLPSMHLPISVRYIAGPHFPANSRTTSRVFCTSLRQTSIISIRDFALELKLQSAQSDDYGVEDLVHGSQSQLSLPELRAQYTSEKRTEPIHATWRIPNNSNPPTNNSGPTWA